MEIIPSPFSDPYSSGSNTQWTDLPDTTTSSDHLQPPARSHSDEEVILASNRPKKRAGRTKFKETRHPVYRGVRRRNSNRWVCELREPNKQTRIWLGTYPSAEMAARAHDVAALALRGQQACLNFADSVWRLPVPATKDAKDIRKTAMDAAEAFRPREDDGVSRSEEVVNTINDEEEMPGLMLDMAEAMMLSPPPCLLGGGYWFSEEESTGAELPLWSYSF